MTRVLVCDDDGHILEATRFALEPEVSAVVTVNNPRELSAALGEPFDVVLLDMNYGPGRDTGEEGLAALAELRAHDPEVAVVCMTAYGDIELAVEAMRRGATDFLIKPWENAKLLATVRASAELTGAKRERSHAVAIAQELGAVEPEVIAVSPAMQDCLALAKRVAATDANVLVLGENGVGKEVVAELIHAASPRSSGPFVAVDLGAMPENLAESELFGHRKGSFSGATENRLGRVAAADGGTLFLDEIANAPLALQAKLLGLLERRRFTPLGSDKERTSDVRVIAATNASDEQLLDAERFRMDLLFRLRTVEIRVPPLRDRPEDLPALVDHFHSRFVRRHQRAVLPLHPSAWNALREHAWPGNVRELRQAVERAVITARGPEILAADFALVPARTAPVSPSEPMTLEALERSALERALRRHQGNVTRAADELGLTRPAFYRRMEKYGL